MEKKNTLLLICQKFLILSKKKSLIMLYMNVLVIDKMHKQFSEKNNCTIF